MATRSTRNQPFCWQEKKILRILKTRYKKSELAKMRNLYLTLTEIDSDFNGKPIQFYTKTISTYSGLSRDFVPSALKELGQLGIIKIHGRKKAGKFSHLELIFTPENASVKAIKIPSKTVAGKAVNGSSVTGDTAHKEDSSYLEDSINKEDNGFVNEKELVDAVDDHEMGHPTNDLPF